MATKNGLNSLLEAAAKFVVNQQGQWQHDEWEDLLAKVSEMGMPVTDETKRALGNILESCKYFYPIVASAAPPKKAAKPKAKAKPRSKKLAAAE